MITLQLFSTSLLFRFFFSDELVPSALRFNFSFFLSSFDLGVLGVPSASVPSVDFSADFSFSGFPFFSAISFVSWPEAPRFKVSGLYPGYRKLATWKTYRQAIWEFRKAHFLAEFLRIIRHDLDSEAHA